MGKKEEKKAEMKEKVSNAVEESRRTGKEVKISLGPEKKEERKRVVGKKVEDPEHFYAEGEGVESILEDHEKNSLEGNCGTFKIIKKEKNEETGEWDYEFQCTETFVAFAQHSLGLEDGIPPGELKKFCMNILLARDSDQLGEGYKVKEIKESEIKRRKFYKKYK